MIALARLLPIAANQRLIILTGEMDTASAGRDAVFRARIAKILLTQEHKMVIGLRWGKAPSGVAAMLR